MSEYVGGMEDWTRIDAGGVGDSELHDIIDGRPPETTAARPALFYPVLDPDAPENLLGLSPWTKLWFSNMPTFVKVADEVQNPETGGWPMLRFMDASGHIADGVRSTIQEMYDGVWTDPATVPDRALRWLASVLGVPASQKNVPDVQLREALVNMVENGKSPVGTRAELANATKQFLTGTKNVSVRPAAGMANFLTPTDQALVTAVGMASVRGLYVGPQRPLVVPTPSESVWVDTTVSRARLWNGSSWAVHEPSAAQAEAVVAEREAGDILRAHTIVIVVRSDQVPGGDLVKLAADIRAIGVVPAGHSLYIITARATWDNAEAEIAAQGGTWDAYERATRIWTDDESLGLADFGE